MAGTMRYPFIQFLIVDGLSAIISVGLVVFGSYFFTESFTLMLGDVERARSSIMVVVLLALVGYGIVRFRRRAVDHDFEEQSFVQTPSKLLVICSVRRE